VDIERILVIGGYLQSFAFLFLILFNIVRASFLSPSYSKYGELTVNGSEG
jgi:hypothetical protein